MGKNITRRDFFRWAGGAGISLFLDACARSLPLKKEAFPDSGHPDQPYMGLATSLPQEYDYEAQVEGTIPADLRGTLYRNGPGLFDRDGLRKRTLLDGDGMVQAFRIHDTGVHYRNRFVRTPKYLEESAAGRFLYPSWSTQAPGGWWANFWAVTRFRSQAGITVCVRNGRLYAFDESSLPFELAPDTLETIGPSRLGLPEGLTLYAAHSKMDFQAGEWLLFGIEYGRTPALHLTIFDPHGGLKSHRRVRMPRFVYMHDYLVSDRHLIFLLHPAEIAFWGFLLGQRSIVESLRWRPEKGNLVMVLDRGGEAEPLYLSTNPCYMWHSINSYEEGGEITADFVGYQNPDHLIGQDPAIFAIMAGRRGKHQFPGEIRRYRINPGTKTIRQELLEGGSYEWPRVNELHSCHKYRFAYLARSRPGEFFWSSIDRIDMRTGRCEGYDFGEGLYCSEAVFAPAPGFCYHADSPHEPGWLLTEVYDGHTHKSFLAILRADRLADGPQALTHLHHHVPFSYHGWWHGRG